MAVGTALAGGLIHYWLGCLFFLIGFWIKLWQEEEVMRRQFPDAYPAYARRVKALVPYLL
jgi:protein-S-isoprenylcysteine O-methyltransferase Ste14